jgi:hypothetical protein
LDEQYAFNPNSAFVALYDAVCLLNQEGNNPTTPERGDVAKPPPKSLTLADLKRQVDAAIPYPNHCIFTFRDDTDGVVGCFSDVLEIPPHDQWFRIGDFDIRRRK